MKQLQEFFRFFFISFEFLLVVVTVVIYIIFGQTMEKHVANIKVSIDGTRTLLAIPPGICIWTFISGRKLLFPDKDKYNILQEWPEFWRLRSGFNAGLTWSAVFAASSIFLWFFDFQKLSPAILLTLLCSIFGASITFISFYNAQNCIEIAASRFVKNKS